jgi:hypothetical protein
MVVCESCGDSCSAQHARDVVATHLARWQAVVELVAVASESFSHAKRDELKAGVASIEADAA